MGFLKKMANKINKVEDASGVSNSDITTIVFPFYIYPDFNNDVSAWSDIYEKSKNINLIAIVNPNSGPGDTINSDYESGFNKLRESVELYGYVHTLYGERDIQTVKDEIKKWHEWYQIAGIFFDEASSAIKHLAYYKELNTFIKTELGAPDIEIMLNPGIKPHDEYFRISKYIVTFENYFTEWKKETKLMQRRKENHEPHSKEKNCDPYCCYCCSEVALVHSCANENQMVEALNIARKKKFSAIFVTNETMPNPWGKLPCYWETENTNCLKR